MQLTENEVLSVLNQLLRNFSIRYRNISITFEFHFQQIIPLLEESNIAFNTLSYSRKLLLGAYFTYESAIESAALYNPCMVAAPDQTELQPGEQRVILSLCAKGDDNQSAIVFRTGILDRFNQLHLEKPGVMPEVGKINQSAEINKQEFLSRLFSLNGHFTKNEVSDLFEGLDEVFTPNVLKQKMTEKLLLNPHFNDLVNLAYGVISSEYEIEFSIDSDLSERVILSEPLHHGIENINFIKFTDTNDEDALYYGILSSGTPLHYSFQLFTTSNFCRFQVDSINISLDGFTHLTLFTRKINNQYALLGSRADGIYLAFSENLTEWTGFAKIIAPEHAWELANQAHVGAPLETPQGWLLLTQATGPMGQRALGAALFSLQRTPVLKARAVRPIFQMNDLDRTGIPGQGISCAGALQHMQMIMVPYSPSKHASGCVSFSTDRILSELRMQPLAANSYA